MGFPERLKELRLKKGLTQKEIAEEFGIKQPNYQQWESGKRKPSSKTLEKFANFFGVTMDYLAGNDEELDNGWRNGPLYVLGINLEEYPIYYTCKFEYEDIKEWTSGISPSSGWAFYYPTDIKDNRLEFTELQNGYIQGLPKPFYKKSYWGLERTIFKSGDLIEINSDNVNSKIFEEFNKLKENSL